MRLRNLCPNLSGLRLDLFVFTTIHRIPWLRGFIKAIEKYSHRHVQAIEVLSFFIFTPISSQDYFPNILIFLLRDPVSYPEISCPQNSFVTRHGKWKWKFLFSLWFLLIFQTTIEFLCARLFRTSIVFLFFFFIVFASWYIFCLVLLFNHNLSWLQNVYFVITEANFFFLDICSVAAIPCVSFNVKVIPELLDFIYVLYFIYAILLVYL